MLALLEHFGYVRNEQGEYAYRSPSSDQEEEQRQEAADEFQRFYEDLKLAAAAGSLTGYEQLLQVRFLQREWLPFSLCKLGYHTSRTFAVHRRPFP